MRTTLTLDDDVAAKLKSEVRRTGRPLREVVNDMLRRGLAKPTQLHTREPFVVRSRSLGGRRPGVNLDSISDLLDQVESPLHR